MEGASYEREVNAISSDKLDRALELIRNITSRLMEVEFKMNSVEKKLDSMEHRINNIESCIQKVETITSTNPTP